MWVCGLLWPSWLTFGPLPYLDLTLLLVCTFDYDDSYFMDFILSVFTLWFDSKTIGSIIVMVTLCSIKGPLNHLWFLDYLLYVGPFTFWPYYKTINIYFMVLYNEHWTFHCFTFTPKVFYDDFLFILPTLYKIKFFFSCIIIKWSITSCSWVPFPCIFYLFSRSWLVLTVTPTSMW